MSGPVSNYLVERVERALQEHLVVVWYDPNRAFSDLFDAEDFSEAEKIRGSPGELLRLRRTVEPMLGSLQAGLNAKPLLVYIDADPLPERHNLLLPLERMGTAYKATLAEVAQRAFRGKAPADKVREWLEVPGLTLPKLDELAEGASSVGPLAAVFGDASPYEVGLRVLTAPHLAEQLDDKLREALTETLRSAFGIALPPDASPDELRDIFGQRVLLREFLDDLDEVPEAFSHLEPAEEVSRGQSAAVRELAEALRNHDGIVDDYRRWGAQAEQAFGLEGHEWDATAIGTRDTFGFEERLALEHVAELARGGDWAAADVWIEERSHSFWARKDQERRAQWHVARTATRLRISVDAALESLPSSKRPEAWTRWYVGEGAEGPAAWTADRLARELAAHHLTFVNEDVLQELVDLARRAADEFERRLAERFVDVLRARTDEWGALPQQSHLFARLVAPLLDDNRKVVLVLADALRYEMGRSLAESLEEDGSTEVDWVVATPPTVTKVGMAALLPGAEDGVELRVEKQKVQPAISGTPLPTIVERRKWLADRYGDRVLDLPLDECLRDPIKRLTKRLASADLIVLRSQDIDQIGETDSVSHAHSFISHVEQQLHAAMRKLTRAGGQEFVVVADHGFILRSDVNDAMKLNLPAGDCIEIHRRCVLGRGLDDGKDYTRLRAAELGLGGGLDLAFPRGINVFKAGGGNLNYLHGGLSLQEVVVPVVRHTPAKADETESAATVTLALVKSKVDNTFFQVKVEYRGQDLFAQAGARRLRIEALKDDIVVGSAVEASIGYDPERRELALETGRESIAMVALTEPLEGQGELELRIVDVRLGETLVSEKVPYDLAF